LRLKGGHRSAVKKHSLRQHSGRTRFGGHERLDGLGGLLTWDITTNFVGVHDSMILASETANDAVSLVNTVELNNATREIRVVDNPNSASDKVDFQLGTDPGAAPGRQKTGLVDDVVFELQLTPENCGELVFE
jgi:hypothetical protein